jgi:hypothetical protein
VGVGLPVSSSAAWLLDGQTFHGILPIMMAKITIKISRSSKWARAETALLFQAPNRRTGEGRICSLLFRLGSRLWLQVDMDVRLSAQFAPLKRPKRLGGRPAEAKWTRRKQPPLPLGLSVHQKSHASDSWPLGRCPAAAQSPAASVGTPPRLRPAFALPPPGTPPRLRPAVALPSPRTCRR